MRSFMEGILFGTVVGGLLGLLNTPAAEKKIARKRKLTLKTTHLRSKTSTSASKVCATRSIH